MKRILGIRASLAALLMPRPVPPRRLRLLVDYGPLVAFFIAYRGFGLGPATLVLILVTALCCALLFLRHRRIPPVPLLTLLLVGVFGGLSLWFDDPTFIKMKPTVIQALFSFLLLGGYLLDRPLLQAVLGEALDLTAAGWRGLTLRLAAFFAVMALLNEIVWRNVSESAWVDFKVFGLTGLTFLFMLAQIPLLKRHAKAN